MFARKYSLPSRFAAPTLALMLGVALSALPARAQPVPPPPDSAGPAEATAVPLPENRALTKRAKDWLHRVQSGTIDRSQLTQTVNDALTEDIVKQGVAKLGPLGTPLSFTYRETKSFPPNTVYVYTVTFKKSTMYWFFSTDDAGKISGFQLLPQPPPAEHDAGPEPQGAAPPPPAP
jgi:hypothetical protein